MVDEGSDIRIIPIFQDKFAVELCMCMSACVCAAVKFEIINMLIYTYLYAMNTPFTNI